MKVIVQTPEPVLRKIAAEVQPSAIKSDFIQGLLQDMRDAIAVMGKDALASYAGAHFKIDLDKRKGVEALRAQVTQLVDQFGVA